MSDKIKIQNEGYYEKLKCSKVVWKEQINQRATFQAISKCNFNARRRNLWLLHMSNQGLSHLCSVTNTTKEFWEIKL